MDDLVSLTPPFRRAITSKGMKMLQSRLLSMQTINVLIAARLIGDQAPAEITRREAAFCLSQLSSDPFAPVRITGGTGGEAAALQGKFWKMHDLIFENQEELERRSSVWGARSAWT